MKKHALKEYLENTGETQTAFADRVGVNRLTIYRIIKNEGEFTTGLIKRVIEATDGHLKPSDFFSEAAA